MWSDVQFLRAALFGCMVSLALALALARSFGRIAAAAIDPALLPADGSLSSRILRWLLTQTAHPMASNVAASPSRTLGASPPSPSLNCHVASRREVTARPSVYSRTERAG